MPCNELITIYIRCLLTGEFPKFRHDGTPWADTDKARAGLKGSLGGRAGLMQLRGDWAWWKQVFSFPAWSNNKICWCCGADKDS